MKGFIYWNFDYYSVWWKTEQLKQKRGSVSDLPHVMNMLMSWAFAHSPVSGNMTQLESRGLLFVSSRGEILWQRRWLFLVIAPLWDTWPRFGKWTLSPFLSSLTLFSFTFHMANILSKSLLTCMIKYRKACLYCLASNFTEGQLSVHLLLMVNAEDCNIGVQCHRAPEALNDKLHSIHKPFNIYSYDNDIIF